MTSNAEIFQLRAAAIEMIARMVDHFTMGANILVKLMPSRCSNPFATNCALNLISRGSRSGFSSRAHLEESALQPGGSGMSSQV